jgi:transglutaminase superfamily protein
LCLLARTRLPWWRNTCLYRALAECLVLRRYGVACRVELGVTRSGEALGAHAWVVRGAGEPEPSAGSMAVFR